MTAPKRIVIDGVMFCRDDETGYYLNGTINVRAHVFVYERDHGPVPPGHHVHHIDEDKANNEPDNLELLTHSAHATHHGLKRAADPAWYEWASKNLRDNAQPRAAKWHRSKDGRRWHREHARRIAAAMLPIAYVCEQCGEGFEKKPFGTNKFCSNACRSAHRRASGVDNISLTCACCGVVYERNRYSKSSSCSRSCANTLRARERRSPSRSR